MNLKYFIPIILLTLLITTSNCNKDKVEEPPINQPPTCDIVNPTDGQQLTKGGDIIIVAEASDNDGIITEVRFFIDNVEKGSDDSSPYNYNWTTDNEILGYHTLKAISFDNEGDSSAVEISVILVDAPGTFTDLRDGQIYSIVEIGSQTWFAENLNFDTPNSVWYDNDYEYGALYGRLYSWDDALSACPTSWHLPSDEEWKTLEMYLGMSQSEANQVDYRGTDEGSKLKNINGWIPYSGTNSSGFKGLPGGLGISDTQFLHRGTIGSWWVANEYSDELAWGRMMSGDLDKVWRGYGNNSYAYSVRCIKD